MDRSDFYKLEYESLRAEIFASQAARRNYEQVGAALITALYGWLTTTGSDPDAPLSALGWWLPPVIALGVAWRGNSLSQGIRKAGRYLARVETELLGVRAKGPIGWHATLAADRVAGAKGIDSEKVKTSLTWYVVAIVTFGIALSVAFL